MSLKPYILLSFGLLSSQFISAQITGKIIDAIDKVPLEYATAALYQQKDSTLIAGVVTLVDGMFSIDDLKPNTYYLEASFMGYDTQTFSDIIISKTQTKKDLGIIALTIGNQLNEVEVTAERATVLHKIDR